MAEDLTGKRFGTRVVTGRKKLILAESGRRRTAWEHRCDCGHVAFSIAGNIRKAKKCDKCSHKNSTHGHSRSKNKQEHRTYSIWSGMRSRCYYPKDKYWSIYGGRGIRVCTRWDKYENFLEDMGLAPEGLQLDRIDSDGDYEAKNCRWVTSKVNNNNRRNNRLLTVNGETQTLSYWADRLGCHPSTIRQRIDLRGWSVEKALTTPVKKQRKKAKEG